VRRYIAFFDFDGTITSKDTLLELIRYQKGSFQLYAGFFIHSPWLIAYKLGLVSNHVAKQKILRFFFRKDPASQFQLRCDEFASKILPRLIRPKALKEIRILQKMGAEVVIVSASAGNWIQPWSESIGVRLIATVLETKKGMLTGRIEGRNCHGKEKPKRIIKEYVLDEFEECYAYGDTKGDKPMMSLASHAFYKPFR
jgi:phosphatidylglycerophosphatase C